jgi:hypothetical protein
LFVFNTILLIVLVCFPLSSGYDVHFRECGTYVKSDDR